jgi:putative membrane protein
MAGGKAEVELGQLAAQKGNSEDVKAFGQKMVDDHTKLNDQMKPVASQLGVTAPSTIPPAEKALETKLKSMSGDAFDKAYMRAMLKDHRQDLMEFKKEASTAKSPQVKEAAAQGEQVISEHLKLAEDVAKKVGATGTTASAKAGEAGK